MFALGTEELGAGQYILPRSPPASRPTWDVRSALFVFGGSVAVITDDCVRLSEVAARLRVHPSALYARAITLGVPVARNRHSAFVTREDADRLEQALRPAEATS